MSRTIGFIGLGLMGAGFTARLVDRGFHVLGYDLDADRCRLAKERGVEIVANPGSVGPVQREMVMAVAMRADAPSMPTPIESGVLKVIVTVEARFTFVAR